MKSIKIGLIVILIMLSFGIQSNIFAQSCAHDANVPTTTEIVILFDGDTGKAYSQNGMATVGGVSKNLSGASSSVGVVPEDISGASSSFGGTPEDVPGASSSGGGDPGDVSGASSGDHDDNGDGFEFGEGFFGAIGEALNAFFNALGL